MNTAPHQGPLTGRQNMATTHTFASTTCCYVTRAFECDHPETRCHAYAGRGGVVRVYDAVAGHFTMCHQLTERQQERVRRLTQPR